MSDGEPTGQVRNGEPVPSDAENEENEWTDFGYGFATVFAAVLFFLGPWYFAGDPFPGNVIGLIFSILTYVGGLVLLMFGINFFSTGMRKTPELRQLFPSLSTGEDAWEGAFGAIIFLVIIFVIQWIMRGFDMVGVAAVVAKLLTYVMVVFVITQVAITIDGFVIRPLIATAAKGPQEFEPLIKRIRQVGVIVGFIVALIAGIATIIDVF